MPLAEHDLSRIININGHRGFNSRAPRGARPKVKISKMKIDAFQFTCPSRSTTSMTTKSSIHFAVSIHVPLAEHDRGASSGRHWQGRFNSRAPRGARPATRQRPPSPSTFQFTCPSRSTTNGVNHLRINSVVSIHVPLAEHDGYPA